MKPLILIAVKENDAQPRSIVVKDNKGEIMATIWADARLSFNGVDLFTEELKVMLNISKNFLTIYLNLKN